MSDPTYEAWRVVRRRCLDDLASMHPSYLRMLGGELARRERPADQQDARLYKRKGRP